MIKLFRKIRYHLMEKNKEEKYFKYVIGEIVLVMIGLLLALSLIIGMKTELGASMCHE